MWVKTQREVCEYYGKDPANRWFVSRKIAKGEIRKVDWGYEFMESKEDEYLQEVYRLREEVKQLEADKAELERKLMYAEAEVSKVWQNVTQWSVTNITVHGNNYDSSGWKEIDHIEYLYERLKMREEVINNVIKSYYGKFGSRDWWEWSVEKIHSMYGYVEDLDEEWELEFISELIKKCQG